MLKTKPKWMRWDVLGSKKKVKSNVKTDNPPVKTKTEERADVKSARDSTVTSHRKVRMEKLTTKPMDTTKNLDMSTDIFKNGLFAINGEVENVDFGSKMRSVSIVRTKRMKDANEDELENNRYNSKRHFRTNSWRLNPKRERSAFSYETLRNRKLSSTLALLFSKIAEERMGDKVIGEDKWDIEDIMFRRISKKLVTNCKYSREKQRLVLMLDSSPSCIDMANTYSEIATEAAMFDDLEIYDAPNGYAHSMYNASRKEFRILTDEELDATYHWNCFEDRTIIYFGDQDAHSSIKRAYKYNEIHWFYQAYGYGSTTYERQLKDTEHLRIDWKDKVNVHMCNDTDQLIKSVRRMK